MESKKIFIALNFVIVSALLDGQLQAQDTSIVRDIFSHRADSIANIIAINQIRHDRMLSMKKDARENTFNEERLEYYYDTYFNVDTQFIAHNVVEVANSTHRIIRLYQYYNLLSSPPEKYTLSITNDPAILLITGFGEDNVNEFLVEVFGILSEYENPLEIIKVLSQIYETDISENCQCSPLAKGTIKCRSVRQNGCNEIIITQDSIAIQQCR